MSHIGKEGTQVLQQLGCEIAAARRAMANYNELKQLLHELFVAWETSHAGQLLDESGHHDVRKQIGDALLWICSTMEAHESVEEMEEVHGEC